MPLGLRAARLNRPQHGPLVSRVGLAQLLALDDNLRYANRAAPGHGADTIAKYEQVETAVRVTPGSFLVSLATRSSHAAGFKFNVFDAQGRALFPTFVHWSLAGTPVSTSGLAKRAQHFLQSPWVVPPPGLLTVRIANLAPAANTVQVCLVFGEPIDLGRNS